MASAETTIRLYGSITSPYVRRVRIVAKELGYRPSFISTQPTG